MTGSTPPSVAGVLLAGGSGSRFGGPGHKLLAPIRAKPVIEWSLGSLLQAGFNTVYVVSGKLDLTEVIDDRATVIHNPRWAEGQATSLQAAVSVARQHGHRAIVVGLADQPFVPAAAWRSVGASKGPIVVGSFDGGRRRPPVKLESDVWDLLPESGDDGARILMRNRPELVSEVACSGNAVDIDTLDELKQWS